jgi:hypothetical protein
MSESLPKDYDLTYHIGQKTIPKIGKIFVFETLQNADNFRTHNKYRIHAILEGHAANIGRPKQLCFRYSDIDDLLLFWKNKKNKKPYKYYREAPNGSLSCDSFTPTKLVWGDQFVLTKYPYER